MTDTFSTEHFPSTMDHPPVNAAAASRRYLRLVRSIHPATPISELELTLRLELTARLARSTVAVRLSAWCDLLDHLSVGEELHLTHTFLRDGDQPTSYGLHVDLLQTEAAKASGTRHAIDRALMSVVPGLRFAAPPKTIVRGPSMPVRARLAPGHLQLAQPVGPGAGGIRQWQAVDEPVPYPGEFPTTLLKVPFDEPLSDELQIQLRFRANALSQLDQARYAGVLQRLRRGALRAFQPESPIGPDSHDPTLAEALDHHLQGWLRCPSTGYAMDVLVRSTEHLTSFTLRRIGRDIFGHFPFDVVAANDEHDLCSDRSVMPLKTTQGLGALFGPDDRLDRFGVTVESTAPSRLPTSGGAEVGCVGGKAVVLPDQLRLSHMAVVGGSGTGKSTFLLRAFQQDLLRGLGAGMIDVHGDLFDQALSVLPAGRVRDLVVIDVGDTEFCVAMNPLEGTTGNAQLQNFVANQILDIIERMFETPESTGPMMRNHVRHALLLAMQHPEGGTIADAARVFEDGDYREWLLSKSGRRLNEYFSAFAATHGDNGFKNWLPYLMARFHPFVKSPALMRMLSRPSTVRLSHLMNEGRVVLIRLSKAVLQDLECQLLGSLILNQFHVAALARTSISPEQRRPFHLYVDEFHTFANDSTPALFREARKFGLGLTVATQSFSSLRHRFGGDLTNAVLANTASKVLFRLSPPDARLVDEYSEPEFTARDLCRTTNYQAVMCMSSTEVPPFRFGVTVPERIPTGLTPSALCAVSGKKFGTPLAEADEYLRKRHGAAAPFDVERN